MQRGKNLTEPPIFKKIKDSPGEPHRNKRNEKINLVEEVLLLKEKIFDLEKRLHEIENSQPKISNTQVKSSEIQSVKASSDQPERNNMTQLDLFLSDKLV